MRCCFVVINAKEDLASEVGEFGDPAQSPLKKAQIPEVAIS
jgi:hypothetical protein